MGYQWIYPSGIKHGLIVLAGKFLNEMEGEGMGLGTIWEDKGDKLTTAFHVFRGR